MSSAFATAPPSDPRAPRGRGDEDEDPTPVMAWDEFLADHFRWNQGEHVTMIGTTGSGKTTMLREIIGLRSYVVIFGVKRRDDSLQKFQRDGYSRISNWNQNMVNDYLLLWPEIKGAGHTSHQQEVFTDAMDAIYRQGGWCIVSDETSYLSDTLNMEKWIKFILQQGRASGVSMVNMTQRPAFIPLACYDQATHLFVWRDNDRRNVQRIGELAGNARRVVEREIPDLARREVLYINKDSGFRVRTTVEV